VNADVVKLLDNIVAMCLVDQRHLIRAV